MRIIPFRDVLWGVAYKFSLDPEQSNFLTNQAIPIGTYIDEWVRRLYDSRDWPEWVITESFAPVNHVVPWDGNVSGVLTAAGSRKIGRVLKVFLVDPSTTDAPVDTAFTLTNAGIHCGYQHGTNVWIRYMAPPPKFTAAQWSAGITYPKDEVVYSYTTGEVYRSKVANNIGHNPVSNFSLPPHPDVIPPPLPEPTTEITQERTFDGVGIAERSGIVAVKLQDAFTGTTPTDPPENGTDFVVEVYDVLTAAILGDFLVTANGTDTQNDVIDAMVAGLTAVPALSAFTFTGNHTSKSITIEGNSSFTAGHSDYAVPSEGGPTHLMLQIQNQFYTPAVAAAPGQPQITQTTITADTTYPGAVYELSVTDSQGVEHTVDYESQLYDDSVQILNGILLAVETAAVTDTFWQGVTMSFDPTGITLDLAIRDKAAVALRPAPTGSGYWELVPFPKAIADAVMRGATADLMREWGQEDKAQAEEQVVPMESDIASGDFTTMPTPPLTGQQAGYSRYKVQ